MYKYHRNTRSQTMGVGWSYSKRDITTRYSATPGVEEAGEVALSARTAQPSRFLPRNAL